MILAGLDGERARTTVGALLPGAFTPAHLARAAHDRRRDRRRAGRSPASTSPTSTTPATPPRSPTSAAAPAPRTGRSPRSASGRDFVAQARAELAGTGIRVATVVNFPGGEEPLKYTRADDPRGARRRRRRDRLRRALAHARRGPRRGGRRLGARDQGRSAAPRRSRPSSRPASSRTPPSIRRAADEALAGGADFLKTSTGKVAVNATPEAAEILLAGDPRQRPRRRPEARRRRAARPPTPPSTSTLCDRMMGEGWATPARFRIGASGVLDGAPRHPRRRGGAGGGQGLLMLPQEVIARKRDGGRARRRPRSASWSRG